RRARCWGVPAVCGAGETAQIPGIRAHRAPRSRPQLRTKVLLRNTRLAPHGCANAEKKGICASSKREKMLAKARWCAIFRRDQYGARRPGAHDPTFEE